MLNCVNSLTQKNALVFNKLCILQIVFILSIIVISFKISKVLYLISQ